MNKLLRWAGPALLAAVGASQSAPAPSFEVASVKAAAPGEWREPKVLEDRIDFPRVTLRFCIAQAWRLKEYQVSGPAWLGQLRYDILAKAPAGAKREQIPEMLQTLLRERFKLEARQEKKEYNVYALVTGKNGPKLKESVPEPGAPQGASFGISMSGTVGKMECKRADMQSLANTLPRFVGRPVVNLTNLAGRFDFELEFSQEDVNGMMIPPPGGATPPTEFGTSIFTSIQRVGLRLDAQKTLLDAIVVASAEKVPIEN